MLIPRGLSGAEQRCSISTFTPPFIHPSLPVHAPSAPSVCDNINRVGSIWVTRHNGQRPNGLPTSSLITPHLLPHQPTCLFLVHYPRVSPSPPPLWVDFFQTLFSCSSPRITFSVPRRSKAFLLLWSSCHLPICFF